MPQKLKLIERQYQLEGSAAVNNEGEFSVVLMKAGEATGHGIEFLASTLEGAVENKIFDGAECFVNHDYWGQSDLRNLGGVYSDVAWDQDNEAITAKLRTMGPSGSLVKQLGKEVLSMDAPKPKVGFSADVLVTLDTDNNVTNIVKCYSVDLVFNPALGGAFTRALNSVQHKKEAESMKKAKEKEVTLQEPAVEEDVLTEDQAAIRELLGVAQEQQALADEAEKNHAIRVAMCAHLLDTGLAASKLPAPAKKSIRSQFEAKVFEPAELQDSIEAQRELVAEIQADSVVAGVPGGGMRVFNSADRLQAAVDDMLGAEREKGMEGQDVAQLSGIRELYLMLTGDRNFHGGYYADRVQLATTADFTGLVKNALNKIVVNTWESLGRAGYDWWKDITVQEHFNSINQVTGTLVGTVGDLPVVAEGGAYTELDVGDSPETADFVKYGGYVPLTLELIDRDMTRKLKQYPRELASAGLRKISSLVAAIFTANAGVGPTMADTGALFNATVTTTAGGHANLLTAALTAAQWDTVAAAVYNQQILIKNEAGIYGTGPAMAVEPRYCLVPRALKKTAWDAFINAWDVTANVHAENLLKGAVVPIVVPEWTDTNNWAAACDPRLVPSIFVGERFGIMPEIFIAGSEYSPAVFTNDETRLKVRHFLAVWVNDFRGLHKSNVV